jgi:surface polysaccharide O-acyltransferase-like enzyme
MMQIERKAVPGDRIAFLDNLRTFMIFCVVLYHAGGVYESGGFWASFWLVDDPATNDLCGILNIIIDVFVMPTIFFIAGFFTPRSLGARGGTAFLKSKLRRLMLPWLIAVLTLIPVYKVIFLYSRNLPQESWTTYFHWSNGNWGQNWLWFLPVLFLFQVVYLLFSKTRLDVSPLPLEIAVPIVFLIGFVYTYAVGFFQLQGWTYTIFLDFQNERLLVYFLIFLLGALCCKRGIFDSPPGSKKLYIAVCCVAWIPINLYIVVLLNYILKPGRFIVSPWVDGALFWLGYHLSVLCLLYLLVATFRYYFNRQGKVLKVLNESAYGVYIIHVVVVGAVALAALNLSLPSVVKYFSVAVLAWLASNLIVANYRNLVGAK